MKISKFTRVFCLLIAIIMTISIPLTSCGTSAPGVDDIPPRDTATLTLYYIVADSTTPEAVEAVEAKLNRITEVKLTTRLKLVALKESEYKATIDQMFVEYDKVLEEIKISESIKASEEKSLKDKIKADNAKGITQPETKKPTEPPKTTILQTEDLIFPDVEKNQFDIFLINSPELFEEYATGKIIVDETTGKVKETLPRLVPMEEELTTKAKVLYSYLHPSLFLAGKFGDKTLAIPTNKTIGNTTYIAVNKRLAEKYELDLKKVTFESLAEYFEKVKAGETGIELYNGTINPDKNFESVFTSMPNFAAVSNSGKSVVYTPSKMPEEKTTDPDATDITGEETTTAAPDPDEETTIPPTTAKPQPLPAVANNTPDKIALTNMYSASPFLAAAKAINLYNENGYFSSGAYDPSKEYAAYMQTLTDEEFASFKANEKFEYEYVVYDPPRATKRELQSAMYAIPVSTVNDTRAMEVITLMNTNKEFKNIFTYGVESINFIYNDDGEIERLNNDYVVDPLYTGNEFLRDLMKGENPDKWTYAREQNLNVVNSVFINFYVDKAKLTPEAAASLDKINSLSEQYHKELLSGTIEDPDAYVADVVTPAFEDAGLTTLMTELKAQTNPE